MSRVAVAGALTAVASLLLALGTASAGLAADAPGKPGQAVVTLLPQRSSDALPRDRAYVVRRVHPGQHLDDVVVARNLTHEPLPVVLHAVDAAVNRSGQFAPAPDGVRTKTGGWIELGDRAVTLPPSGEVQVPVHIDVPSDARSGDHLAAVTVEKRAPTDVGNGIALAVRVGVRVYLTVGGGAASFDISRARFSGTADHPRLLLTVAATGARVVEPLGSVRLHRGSLGNLTRLPVLGSVPPHDSRTFAVALPGPLDPGAYDADVRLRLLDGRASATKRVHFEIGGAPSGHGFPWWILVALIVLVLLALLAALLWWRRRQAHPAAAVSTRDALGLAPPASVGIRERR